MNFNLTISKEKLFLLGNFVAYYTNVPTAHQARLPLSGRRDGASTLRSTLAFEKIAFKENLASKTFLDK